MNFNHGFIHGPVVEREALCADGGVKTSGGRHPMARQNFSHRRYGKVESLGTLAFGLGAAVLLAAIMGGVFSCGMTGWSKYFC